jgi:hypothetical protein
MTDEPQIGALQEEIRRAGQDARDKRWSRFGCCLGAGVFWLLFLFFPMAWAPLGSPYDPPGVSPESKQRDFVIWFVLLSVALIAMPPLYARFLHWRLRRRIRRRLSDVSPAARAEILLPLRVDSRWETRAIVAPHLREFGIPSEVAPATPISRGDEASPAEG